MASLTGAIFDEFSTLNAQEKIKAVMQIGQDVSFAHLINQGGGGGTLQGTPENDVFFINQPGTEIDETHTGGIDIAISSVSYEMDRFVEHLLLTGSDNLTGTGNTLDNVITGNDGDNTLDGGTGDDLLLGGKGNDELIGGVGDDTLCGGDNNDTIFGGTGEDMIDGNADDDSIAAGDGSDTVNGAEGDDIIQGDGGEDCIMGGAGNDTIDGGAAGDNIASGDGDDSVSGGIGQDTLYGGAGNDTFVGGTGHDSFYFGEGDGTTRIEDYQVNWDTIVVDINVNGSGITSVNDILATLHEDTSGNAVITLGTKTVTLVGFSEDDVDADFFKIG